MFRALRIVGIALGWRLLESAIGGAIVGFVWAYGVLARPVAPTDGLAIIATQMLIAPLLLGIVTAGGSGVLVTAMIRPSLVGPALLAASAGATLGALAGAALAP
jgi:hypothetical protein